MAPEVHQWPAQQRVHHSSVAVALPEEISDCHRVLLATTRSLVGSQIAAAVRAAIGDRLVAETAAMRAHSPVEDVLALATLLRTTRAERVVTLGGGSVIDGAKVACFAVWQGIAERAGLLAHATGRGTQREAWRKEEPTPRLVSVPTTLSAAEFAAHAGITETTEGRKYRFLDSMQVPRAVILDPKATLETPSELLLSSGIRALDHAAERWCAEKRTPFSDAVSHQAMQLLAISLPRIRRDPEDLTARAMAVMGGWSGVAVGASHGIGYILGGARGVPHGITSCLGLPAVMRWNEPVNAVRQQDIARLLGGVSGSVALRDVIRGLGLPTTLAEVGIGLDEIPSLASKWDGGPPIATNPRPVHSAADVAEIMALMA